MQLFSILSLLVTSAVAAPATSIGTNHNASFDDITANPITAQLTPIPTPYDSLSWSNFNARADGVSILRAHSPSNTASFSGLNANSILAKVPTISTSYPGSTVQSFTLYSTYIGCAVTTEASTGIPQACTLQFTGTTTTGGTVYQLCSYSGTVLNPAMVLCTFPSTFTQLKNVTALIASSVTVPTTTVEYLDNVIYETF